MLRLANNKHQAFIGKTGIVYGGSTANPATALTAGTVVTKDNLADGAIAVVTLGNKFLENNAALIAVDRYKIVQGRGASNPLSVTAIVNRANTVASAKRNAPAVQQVTTISSFTDALTEDSSSYFIIIEKQDNDASHRQGYWPSITGQFKTDASATGAELSQGLGSALFQNTLFEAGDTKYVRVTVTSNGTAGADVADTVVATRNSKSVETAATAAELTTAEIVAGAAIEIVGVGGFSDTYIVASTVDGVITLTTAYRGDSGAVTTVKVVDTPTSWSIVVRGVQPSFDVLRNRDYAVNRFKVKIMTGDEMAPMPVVNTTNAYEGIGTWEQVAMDEFLHWGFIGQGRAILDTPPGSRPAEVVQGAGYDTICLVETNTIPGMTSSFTAGITNLIYVDTAADQPGSAIATLFGASFS